MGFVQRRGPRRYRARYRAPDGRERSRTFARKVDAEKFLANVEADQSRGQWVDPRHGKVSLAEWADRWLGTTIHLKPWTRAGYESLLRSHVLPRFGPVELRRIDTVAVREWIAELQASGLGPSRIRQARQVLSAVLRAAVESGYLARNPVEGVKVPRERRREMLFLTAEEVDRLAAAVGEEWETLIYLLAYGGLRWGEAVALRRSRCDLLRSRVEVSESLAEVGGKLHFGPTKTYQRRTVILPAFLRDRLAVQLANRGGDRDHDPLVFTTPSGRPLRHSNFSARIWKPALAAAGLPEGLRIHDLRHTCVALLIAQGAHPKAIQAHLGHSSITVTLDRYGHLFPSETEALAERLEAAYRAVSQQRAASPRPGGVIDLRQPLSDKDS